MYIYINYLYNYFINHKRIESICISVYKLASLLLTFVQCIDDSSHLFVETFVASVTVREEPYHRR